MTSQRDLIFYGKFVHMFLRHSFICVLLYVLFCELLFMHLFFFYFFCAFICFFSFMYVGIITLKHIWEYNKWQVEGRLFTMEHLTSLIFYRYEPKKEFENNTWTDLTTAFNIIWIATLFHSNDIYHQPMNWFELTLIKGIKIVW